MGGKAWIKEKPMERPIMKDILFLQQPSEPATEDEVRGDRREEAYDRGSDGIFVGCDDQSRDSVEVR